MPVVGVEPTCPQGHTILSRARLPIPPHRRERILTLAAASVNRNAARTKSLAAAGRALPGLRRGDRGQNSHWAMASFLPCLSAHHPF